MRRLCGVESIGDQWMRSLYTWRSAYLKPFEDPQLACALSRCEAHHQVPAWYAACAQSQSAHRMRRDQPSHARPDR
jgi:hypothetical protein